MHLFSSRFVRCHIHFALIREFWGIRYSQKCFQHERVYRIISICWVHFHANMYTHTGRSYLQIYPQLNVPLKINFTVWRQPKWRRGKMIQLLSIMCQRCAIKMWVYWKCLPKYYANLIMQHWATATWYGMLIPAFSIVIIAIQIPFIKLFCYQNFGENVTGYKYFQLFDISGLE